MAKLEDFLTHNVEGYLFWDLRAMQHIIALPGEPGGGLGYPLLMTSFAGIELLGALMSRTPFSTAPSAGYQYFEDYWQRFLYPNSGPPAKEINLAYRLARNGIAHNYVLKGPLGIVKAQPAFHLTHGSDGTFYIDCSQLASDLVKSYELLIKPFLSSPTATVDAAVMTARLAELLSAYEAQARANLPNQGTLGAVGIGLPSPGQPSGATGVTGPVSSSVSKSKP